MAIAINDKNEKNEESTLMKFTSEKWVNHYKATVQKMKAEGKPTANIVGACAVITFLRDGLIDDLGAGPEADAIKESIGELLKCIQARNGDGKYEIALEGFGGNASYAAKKAGYAASSAALDELS